MKVLFIDINMHTKNLNALLKYDITMINYRGTDLDKFDLSQFDVVYSPSQPIDIKKYPNTKFIFGPHFSVFPEQHQIDIISGNNAIYVQPSKWVMDVWMSNPICNRIRVDVLPFGVDTVKFSPSKSIVERNEVFIYYKTRHPNEFNLLYSFLKNKNLNPRIFSYDNKYPEQDFINYSQQTKFAIWLGRHESQGFALEETLACDIPLLVWNSTSMNQEYNLNYPDIPATTIPYWDDRCGEYFTDIQELPDVYNKFISKLNDYKPREFILEKLSMEKCEKIFIDIVKKI